MCAISVFLCSQTSWKVWDWTLVALWCGRTASRAGGRSVYGHVITKFSRMGSLLHFLTHGAPLRALRARELSYYLLIYFYKRCNMSHSIVFLGKRCIIIAALRCNRSISAKVVGEQLPNTDMEKVTCGMIVLKYISSKSLNGRFRILLSIFIWLQYDLHISCTWSLQSNLLSITTPKDVVEQVYLRTVFPHLTGSRGPAKIYLCKIITSDLPVWRGNLFELHQRQKL